MRTLKKLDRNRVYELITAVRIKNASPTFLENLLAESEFHEQKLDECSERNIRKIVLEQTKYEYGSARNGFLAQIYQAFCGEQVEVLGERLSCFPCPCCGLLSLTEPYNVELGTGYDICPHCGWEDDGTTHRDVQSSVNKGSIQDYLIALNEKTNLTIRQRWAEK